MARVLADTQIPIQPVRHRQPPLGYQRIGVDARAHHPGAGVEMYWLTLGARRQFGRPWRLSVLAFWPLAYLIIAVSIDDMPAIGALTALNGVDPSTRGVLRHLGISYLFKESIWHYSTISICPLRKARLRLRYGASWVLWHRWHNAARFSRSLASGRIS